MISHDHGCLSILAEHTSGTSGSYESLDEASGSTGKEAAVLQPSLSEEAAARQPGEELRGLRGEAASRGLDWLGGALAEIGRDQLRGLGKLLPFVKPPLFHIGPYVSVCMCVSVCVVCVWFA